MHRPPLPSSRLLLAVLMLALGCDASTDGRADPPDTRGCSDWPSRPGELLVSLDGASQFEVESFLLTDGDDVIAVWEAYGCDDVTRVGYAARTASGFERPRYLSSPNGQMASNVTIARDGGGALYAAWASWTPGPDRAQPHMGVTDIRIQLARRPAGATAFDAPVELSEPIPGQLYDKPWMTITPDGALLVSYSDLVRGGIWVASSVDGGASFQRTRVDTAWANLAALCLDGRPGGAYVTYFANEIRVAHTDDGGATWSAPRAVARIDPTGSPACQDPTCVAQADQVWISYGRTHDGYDMPVARLREVQVAHLTWGSNDLASNVTALAAAPDAAFLLFPQLTRLPDGTLALAAYRARSAAAGEAELVYTTSTDSGRSFAPFAVLASGLAASLERHVPDWLGDYFGWAPVGSGVGAAFIDNRSGASHIAYRESTP